MSFTFIVFVATYCTSTREVFPLVTSHLVPLGLGGVAVDSGLGLVGEEAEGVDLQRAVQI